MIWENGPIRILDQPLSYRCSDIDETLEYDQQCEWHGMVDSDEDLQLNIVSYKDLE